MTRNRLTYVLRHTEAKEFSFFYLIQPDVTFSPSLSRLNHLGKMLNRLSFYSGSPLMDPPFCSGNVFSKL